MTSKFTIDENIKRRTFSTCSNIMLNLEIPDQIYEKAESHHRRRIRRLPPLLCEEEGSKHNYTPRVIALGPFHHGKPELQLGETFKHKALHTFLSAMGKEKSFFYDKIMADIDDIRECYDQVSSNEHDDSSLAGMMLLDGCFVVCLMEVLSNSERLVDILYAIGMVGFSYATRDMIMLENQIPFRVITLLIRLRYDNAREGEDLLNHFLNFCAFQGHFSKTAHKDAVEEEAPVHLLEAIRRKLVSKPRSSNISRGKKDQVSLRTRLYTSRSVTDLKAKGVGFQPGPTACLRDVKFTSHGVFNGNLELPPRCISDRTKVLFANLVAYETSSGNINDYAVSSYINLMKSLIHCAEDVKELREKGILVSNLGSDDQVFRGFKEIDTHGAENAGIFHDVKERIEEHYNSKAKTYMAELKHTYFESPWTAIALLAAALLLLLTSLQTYFTIHPSRF